MGLMYLPVIQVRNSQILLYNQYQGTPKRTENLYNVLECETYTGRMTKTSTKKMQKALDLLLQITPKRMVYNPVTNKYIPFKLNFVTLTTPDPVNRTAAEMTKNCLEPTLRRMRTMGMKNYIWKAELQERGQIHYHLATDNFIHYQTLNRLWNKNLKKFGYLDTYAKRYGHFYPNSTDVHAVMKVNDVAAYMAKYLMKGVGGAGTKGKVWDCNAELKTTKFFTTEQEGANEYLIQKMKIREWAGEYCYLADIPQGRVWQVLTTNQRKQYAEFINNLRGQA